MVTDQFQRFALIFPDDGDGPPVQLFHHIGPSRKVELRAQYKPLACRLCGKIDERKALELGLSPDITINESHDLLSSYESLYITSTRLREIIESIPGSNVDFFTLPSTPNYNVALPRKVYLPVKGQNSFRLFTNRCNQCGRYREVVRGDGNPEIQEQCVIGVFFLENRVGMMSVWVAKQDVIELLQTSRPRVTGLCYDPQDEVILSSANQPK
jgi:hypothetical protein